jgi:hypothetical protein
MIVPARFQRIMNFSSAEQMDFARRVVMCKYKQHKTDTPQGKIKE